jgi:hypothetical protein
MKTQNYKFVDFIESSNFDIKSTLIWHDKNDIIFLMRHALVHDYYATKILYYFLSILTTPNVKTQNYKVIELWELQLWCKKCFHLTPYRKDIISLMWLALVRGYYASKILYYFCEHLNVLWWKN